MNEPVKAGSSTTRWQEAQEATIGLARFAEQYDDDGISVTFFANKTDKHENVVSGGDLVKKLFTDKQPNGGTDTALMIQEICGDWLKRKAASAETKPLILFVVTDGEPNSKDDLQKAIEEVANKVSGVDDIRINFIQVGDNKDAAAYLHHLDTELTCKYDIVNAKNEAEVSNYNSLSEAILAMVNDMAEATA